MVLRNIISDIVDNHNGHHQTGNTDTICLIDALAKHGFAEVMYKIVNTTSYPGWGYLIEHGATAIRESWGVTNGDDSMIM
jgi:alpha-L-rhamnosidase